MQLMAHIIVLGFFVWSVLLVLGGLKYMMGKICWILFFTLAITIALFMITYANDAGTIDEIKIKLR